MTSRLPLLHVTTELEGESSRTLDTMFCTLKFRSYVSENPTTLKSSFHCFYGTFREPSITERVHTSHLLLTTSSTHWSVLPRVGLSSPLTIVGRRFPVYTPSLTSGRIGVFPLFCSVPF